MKETSNFQDFLSSQVPQISLKEFALSLALSVILGFLLKKIFERFSHVQGNKALIGNNLMLVLLTTMIIISVVKSSLALSLGLVGALSIVRFRTAIKDPEELAYLFIAITMGLGLGADQRVITCLGFCFLSGVILFLSRRKAREKNGRIFHLVITQKLNPGLNLKTVQSSLEKKSQAQSLKRWEISEQEQEAAFQVILQPSESIKILAELQGEFPGLRCKLYEPLDLG